MSACPLERRGPHREGAPVRSHQQRGQSRRGCEGVLLYLDSTPTHSYTTSRVVHADHGRSGMGRKARWTKGGWSNDGQQSIVLTMPSLICVIDDDRSVLRALRRLLWAEAFAVEVFGSAEEFLASEHRANARCLVLDVNLTGLSGLELQEQLLLTGASPPTPSVLWPPNSILTATLLLTPVRRWWLYLLAALPAHLAAELPVLPPLLVIGLFATNCVEALVAAAGLRWFSDAPTRFDTLRRMVGFVLVGALVAPFVSSFPDAALVAALQGESYSVVWRTRFFSNVLGALTIVPAVVMAVRNGLPNLRAAAPRRYLEAGLLAGGLFLARRGQLGHRWELVPGRVAGPPAR